MNIMKNMEAVFVVAMALAVPGSYLVDGIPNRYDHDIDNDGVRNSRDRDRDGDGVQNRWDDRPSNPYRR